MQPEEKQIRKLYKAMAQITTKSKPGDTVTLRDGTQYHIGPRGNWIKIGKVAPGRP